MYDIYYSHHRWKYNTTEEDYELDLIRRYFPNAKIFNPSKDLTTTDSGDEVVIMQECLEAVRNSDILVFSSLDGCVGTGVFHEVMEAKKMRKLIFYIYHDKLMTDFHLHNNGRESEITDRLYALVDFE